MEGLISLIIFLGILIAFIASYWIIFTKAGESGWKCLIPIYNFIILLNITKKPIWWIILMFIPLINIGVIILINIALSESFGKGTGFGIGLTLLPIVFAPLLAFGDAEYVSD